MLLYTANIQLGCFGMNYDDLLDGNGQEIYVDLYIIDAKNEWYDEQNKRIVYPKYLPSEDFNPFV